MLLIDIKQKCFGYQRTDQRHQTQTAAMCQDNSFTLIKMHLTIPSLVHGGDTIYSHTLYLIWSTQLEPVLYLTVLYR